MKFLFTFLISVFCFQLWAQNITNLVNGQTLTNGQQLTTVPSGGASLTCQYYATLVSSYNSGAILNNIPSIALTPTVTTTFCQVVWTPAAPIVSTSAHLEVRTAVNGGGTLLATSPSVTPAAWAEEDYSFTFTVTGGTTVYISRIANLGDGIRLDNPASLSGFTAVPYYGTLLLSTLAPGTTYNIFFNTMQ